MSISPKKTVTIIRHTYRPPCQVEDVLRDLDFVVQVVIAPIEGVKHIDPLVDDLIYIAGGPIGVYQADLYPFLHDEMEIIRARHAAGKVTLGVCLGGQLIAKALGGDVIKGTNGLEYAWNPLILADNAADHPVRHLCGTKTNMFHWHQDEFILPEGAVHLASSSRYPNQAFEVDKHTFGFQCHPEVKEGILNEWTVHLVDRLTGESPLKSLDEFREDAKTYTNTLNTQTRVFLTEWLERAGVI